jgi:hypothetical protein
MGTTIMQTNIDAVAILFGVLETESIQCLDWSAEELYHNQDQG